jgi:hypothetical protein
MVKYVGWLKRSFFVLVCYAMCATPVSATVKLLGDFEGSLDSPYTNDWSATSGILGVDFISATDPDYHGGITLGDQALLLTTPNLWSGDPYFVLNGGEDMMRDMAEFPYLLFDVTTYGGVDTPDEGPIWRQVFNIFNNAVTTPTWYDSNPDSDIQRDFPVPGFADESLTTTVVVDMTGPEPAVGGDGVNFMQLKAQQGLADHTDGTPIPNFYWEIRWVFQGGNSPDSSSIQMVIDNVRLCDTLDCTPNPPGLAGDYNDNGSVDASDYVVWRNNLNGTSLPNETVSLGTVDQADYDEWRAHFGGSALPAAGAGVPEPTGILLMLIAAASLVPLRPVRR